MKPDHDDALRRVAEAVSDGEAVDWDIENQRIPNLRTKLDQLRALERIGATHRDASPASASGHEVSPPPGQTEVMPSPGKEPSSGTDSPPEPELSIWGTLHVERMLGGGSCADVYRAFDPALRQDVALKLLRDEPECSPQRAADFLEEARRLARVRHENLLVVHGAAEHAGRAGIWTELIEGETLEQQLRDRGRFGAAEAVAVGIDLCRALAAVHAVDLVHRDVKTTNIMRERNTGRLVLMDFSSALERSPRAWVAGTTTLFTPSFMAPELFEGIDADPRSDIYSLGVVLYRLVTDGYPVAGQTFEEIQAKHQRGQSKPLQDVRPDLQPAFVQAIERAISPDPAQRYQSAGEMERGLAESIGGSVPVQPTPPSPPKPRFPTRAVLAAAASVAVVALAIWLFLIPSPFDVEASLYRHHRGADERLAAGAEVRPGDQLFLEVAGSEDLHLYVANEDDRGLSYALFPLPGFDLQNPLGGQITHRLPGTKEGTANYWDVSSVGGTETLLVIASRKPLPDVEEVLAAMTPAGADAGRAETEVAPPLKRLRGIGGLAPDDWAEEGDSTSSLSGLQGRVSVRSARKSGLWVWEIVLHNPGR